MNNFEVMEGQKLKVSILQDGPKDTVKEGHKEEDLGEDTTNTYLHSAKDRAQLMQKLMGQKESDILADQNAQKQQQAAATRKMENSENIYQSTPSICLLFVNLFDPTIVDLKKDPSFFIDIKEQVIQVCGDFGKVEKVFVEQRSEGRVWIKFQENDIKGATETQ